MNKIAHISVRDNRKIYFTKKPKAFFYFSLFSSQIFRLGLELPQDLIYRPGFLSKALKILRLNSEFCPGNSVHFLADFWPYYLHFN